MIKRLYKRLLVINYFAVISFIYIFAAFDAKKSVLTDSENHLGSVIYQISSDNPSIIVGKLNTSLQTFISNGDTSSAGICLNTILKNIRLNTIDSMVMSNSYYYMGVFYLITGKNQEGINWLRLSAEIRENLKKLDEIYAKCLYNIGVAYNFLGDFNKMEQYSVRSFEIEKTLYGETSPVLLQGLSNLVTACLELKEYEKSISYGNTALKLVSNQEGSFLKSDIADLYINIGVCHTRLADYSKARLYLEKAESIYLTGLIKQDERYINLLNNLAVTYGFLGLNEKSGKYYERGISMAESYNSGMTFNLINSYAIVLGNTGKIKKGEELLANSLEKAKNTFGSGSRTYFEVLKNYAEYLRVYKIDKEKSLLLYKQCLDYLNNHKEDLLLRDPVLIGYAVALSENGESLKALESIQELLFLGLADKANYNLTSNPKIDQIEPDRRSLKVLKAKYVILWDNYKRSGENEFLKAIAGTSELIISILEKVRINISEEESRLVLGDRYRDSYIFAIRDFDLCHKKLQDPFFLEKAFEYSEKSKVAGLLASTRELKATQFHIPSDIAELERKLQNDISFYTAKLAEEKSKQSPNSSLISEWNGKLLNITQRRDSLIDLFEKKYPEYYLIKYNTQVVNFDNISGIIGRNNNYLNYVVADTVIYLFIANRKYQKLLTISIDSTFFDSIMEFRNLLSMPSPLNNAGIEFNKFQKLGYNLYNTLVEPARKYLISNKILISPDNILTYVPFETIPTTPGSGKDINYKDLSYMMKDFKISYTYSATFLAESVEKDFSLTNSLIAFAPVYTDRFDIDSLLYNRKGVTLHDLPYARQEAEYVSEMSGGELYINNEAREALFKSEAGKYDIIHLAMHTILNDQYPMHSKMLFYLDKDSVEDDFLNTYEIYGIPLKAKMVVLSSCNTGFGVLHSGEGILSLARGFIYSGSQSVIMSMWEVEDKSGTEIVKGFYQNLKKGNTKSNALRKARIDFLKKADQLRSHPYFWSTLVVYGNNAPLYYSKQLFLMVISGFSVIFLSLFFYSMKFR